MSSSFFVEFAAPGRISAGSDNLHVSPALGNSRLAASLAGRPPKRPGRRRHPLRVSGWLGLTECIRGSDACDILLLPDVREHLADRIGSIEANMAYLAVILAVCLIQMRILVDPRTGCSHASRGASATIGMRGMRAGCWCSWLVVTRNDESNPRRAGRIRRTSRRASPGNARRPSKTDRRSAASENRAAAKSGKTGAAPRRSHARAGRG